MSNLFKKAAVATDLHLGLKGNSIQHNEDCLEFITWFIQKAKSENCETAIICGDWHNHRASINILSLSYSMKCLELLNASFDMVYFLQGNHDIFYRDRRTVSSVLWADYLPNIKVIDDIFTDGDVTLCPWLVGDEAEKVKKINTKYVFGHFELPNFYMNSQVLMPDHGDFHAEDLGNAGQVFSGHFHKRQSRKNIWYIGNAFPHNYADAGDDARGMMILKWGEEPEFHAWPGQPLFRVYKLSAILDNPAGLLLPKSNVRVHLDIDISFEEAAFIRETLVPTYGLREMSLIPIKQDFFTDDSTTNEVHFQSVDTIITESIANVESDFYDTKLLLELYRNL